MSLDTAAGGSVRPLGHSGRMSEPEPTTATCAGCRKVGVLDEMVVEVRRDDHSKVLGAWCSMDCRPAWLPVGRLGELMGPMQDLD